MKDKLLSLLGICRKAGKLVMGFDAVAEAALKDRVPLVLLASDLSPKSKKEIEYIAAKANVEIAPLPATIEEIGQKIGRRAGVLAVADKGLADAVKKTTARVEEDMRL